MTEINEIQKILSEFFTTEIPNPDNYPESFKYMIKIYAYIMQNSKTTSLEKIIEKE